MLSYIQAEQKVLAPHDVEYVISRPEVQELLLFIRDCDEPPILRTIKAAFSDWDTHHLSEIIDLLINEGYINRHDRRYYYQVPTITEEERRKVALDVERLHFQWDMEISNWIKQWTVHVTKEQIPLLMMLLHQRLEQDLAINRPKLIDVQSDLLTDELVMINQANLPKASFIGLSSLNQCEIHFHDYLLQANRNTVEKNPVFEDIYNEIGDVNGEYLMDQCVRKLKRANRRGKLIETEQNIFNDTLVELNYFSESSNQYFVNIPLWRCDIDKINELLDIAIHSKVYQMTVERLNTLGERVNVSLLPYWIFTNISMKQLRPFVSSWIYIHH